MDEREEEGGLWITTTRKLELRNELSNICESVKSALHTTLHDVTWYSTRVADKAHFPYIEDDVKGAGC